MEWIEEHVMPHKAKLLILILLEAATLFFGPGSLIGPIALLFACLIYLSIGWDVRYRPNFDHNDLWVTYISLGAIVGLAISPILLLNGQSIWAVPASAIVNALFAGVLTRVGGAIGGVPIFLSKQQRTK